MQGLAIRRLIASLGLTVPITALAGCGDPCRDDGLGQIGTFCGELPDEAEASGSDGGQAPEEEPPEEDPPDEEPPDDEPPDEEPPDAGDETGAAEPDMEVAFLRDADADGYGDPDDALMADPAAPPAGYVPASAGDDCDDDDPATHPGAAEHEATSACTNDDDDDGWADETPAPGVTAGRDCDDASLTTYPGAAEHEPATACTKDDDGDGWGDRDVPAGVDPGGDCADGDPALFGCHTLWCKDMDGDGYGNPVACVPGGDVPPSNVHVANDDDCDDANPAMHPGKALAEPGLCTVDADGDGYGPVVAPPGGDAGTDCDDGSPLAFPGASEHEPAPLDAKCTHDGDGDGYGDAAPNAGIVHGTDCDDTSADTHPGAAELEDALACMTDEDLDGYGELFPEHGVVSGMDCEDGDPTVTTCSLWCMDGDGDGYGDPLAWGAWAEDPGHPWVQDCSDCDDADLRAFPGAAEAEPSLCTLDGDLDGYGDVDAVAPLQAGTDCDDASAAVHPGAAALEPELCTSDVDGDGYGDAEAA